MMAKLDYWGIENEIAQVIREETHEMTVTVEQQLLFSPETTPYVNVSIASRDLAPNQTLAAGRRVRYNIHFDIWVWCFSMELADSIRRRDEAIAEVEQVLMGNRTLNDKVETSWSTGGRLPSSKLPANREMSSYSGGYLSGGEIKLVAVVESVLD